MNGLNVGCGEFYARGWLNIDVTRNDEVNPDEVADVVDLPYEDESFDRVYAGHVIEHVPDEMRAVAIRELVRVARDEVLIVAPDIERVRAVAPEIEEDVRTGGCRWDGDEHHWVGSEHDLYEEVVAALRELDEGDGVIIEKMPIAQIVSRHWPIVSKAPWQCAVRITK